MTLRPIYLDSPARSSLRTAFLAVRPYNPFGFASFIFLTAIVFLRPGDMFANSFPEIQSLRLYWVGSLLCLAFLYREVFQQLTPRELKRRPLSVCVLGIMFAAILSLIVQGQIYDARMLAIDCLIPFFYYFFLISIVNTPQRLRTFLQWLAVLIITITALGILQYHGLIDVNAAPYSEAQDYVNPETGQDVVLLRLCSIGVYDNPNDLARILVVGTLLCMYFLGDSHSDRRRYLWAIAIAILSYALAMTYSRGGLLALMAGLAYWFYQRFGRTKTIIVAALGLPLMLIGLSGRMADLSMNDGTAQDRIQLWRDAFAEMKSAPIFGIGVGNLADRTGGLLAHNSFIQSFAEMGLFGGTIFAGAFYLALWAPFRLGRFTNEIPNPQLRRLRTFLIAIMIAVVVGMFSSTRNLKLETYLLLGLMAVYLRVMEKFAPASALKLNWSLVRRVIAVGAAVIVFFNLYVRIAAN